MKERMAVERPALGQFSYQNGSLQIAEFSSALPFIAVKSRIQPLNPA